VTPRNLVQQLMREAERAGDADAVAICVRALDGDAAACRSVAEMIAAAAAMDDRHRSGVNFHAPDCGTARMQSCDCGKDVAQ